jgi:site-specific recombinase XerD
MSQTRDFSIRDAVDRHLRERQHEVSESTLQNQRYALKRFVEFCDSNGIEAISELDGFDLADFRLERQEAVSSTTVYNNLTSLRTFVRWCEQRDLLPHGLADGMTVPNREGEVRETALDADRAKKILSYLEKYEYASFRHTMLALLWDTGMRVGTLRALDIGDVHADEQYAEARHRPETDTPLKNGVGGEREINLHQWAADVVSGYIQERRDEKLDRHGRRPLLTTRDGRPRVNTLRYHVYRVTSPCYYGSCPHGRDPDNCVATAYSQGSKCPSSLSPHPVRRGAITAWLNDGHAKELLSDRMDVSTDVLEKHYDARSESEKRELRREAFGMEET